MLTIARDGNITSKRTILDVKAQSPCLQIVENKMVVAIITGRYWYHYRPTLAIFDLEGQLAQPLLHFGADTATNDGSYSPWADDAAVTTKEDEALTGQLTGRAGCGAPLTFSLVDNATKGTASVESDGQFTYTPNENEFGTDSFTFQVMEGLRISATATVDIAIKPVNDPPVAEPQSFEIVMNAPIQITLTGSDVDQDALEFAVKAVPLHGQLSGTSRDLTYSPDHNYVGADSFTFVANDGEYESAMATIDIMVTNQAPVARAMSIGAPKYMPVEITLEGQDVDGHPIIYMLQTRPTHGLLFGRPPNCFYIPHFGYTGPDSITFKVSDGVLESETAMVDVFVGAKLGPTIWTGLEHKFTKVDWADSTLPKNQDRITDNVWLTRGDFMGLFNAQSEGRYGWELSPELSPEGTEWATGSASDWASLSFQTWGNWHGWYPPGVVGVDAVVHLVKDDIYLDIRFTDWTAGGGGGFSYQRAAGQRLRPTAEDAAYHMDEDSVLVGQLHGDDSGGEPLLFALVAQAKKGTATVYPDGAFTYVPRWNVFGADSFQFKVSNQQVDSKPAKVSIDISPVNDLYEGFWLMSHGLPFYTDLEQDLNGDGVDLLMAYALNLDPRTAQAEMPRALRSPGGLSMTYYASAPGITYKVMTSCDMVNWTTDGVTLSAPDAAGMRTATVDTVAPCRFMRLVVERQ